MIISSLTCYASSLHLRGVLQQQACPDVYQGGMGVLCALPEAIAGWRYVDWEGRPLINECLWKVLLKSVFNLVFVFSGVIIAIGQTLSHTHTYILMVSCSSHWHSSSGGLISGLPGTYGMVPYPACGSPQEQLSEPGPRCVHLALMAELGPDYEHPSPILPSWGEQPPPHSLL